MKPIYICDAFIKRKAAESISFNAVPQIPTVSNEHLVLGYTNSFPVILFLFVGALLSNLTLTNGQINSSTLHGNM